MGAPEVTPTLWTAALAPVLLLFATVVSGRVSARVGAMLALAATLGCATAVFRATPTGVAVAVGKGTWLGLWILLVVWPALLLYRIVAAVGFTRIGEALSGLLPGRCERLLAVAWLFPSFVQGVAGFGTPIAVAAPLLLAMGWSRARSVALPLVGYHWSVTFGSMGSSFYVASLTAGLGAAGQDELALRAGMFLGLNCLVAGALVLLMDGGLRRLREGLPLLLVLGLPTAATLVGVAALVPAVASLVAATVGLGLLWLTSRWSGPVAVSATVAPAGRPHPAGRSTVDNAAPRAAGTAGVEGAVVQAVAADPGTRAGRQASLLLLLCPYVFLLLTALPVFLVPPSRNWVRSHLLVGPGFPATHTHQGWVSDAVARFNPVAVLGHPGGYILFAGALGYTVYRRVGLLDRARARHIVGGWARSLPAASVVILALTTVAMVMSDSGMISVLARGTESATGRAFPVLSPVVGAIGSFTTGSTASSNALLAAFQAQVAHLLGADPAVFVAAQTAGSNVGNLLTPVIILIGLSAVGAPEQLSVVLRYCVRPAGVLLAAVAASVLAAVWLT